MSSDHGPFFDFPEEGEANLPLIAGERGVNQHTLITAPFLISSQSDEFFEWLFRDLTNSDYETAFRLGYFNKVALAIRIVPLEIPEPYSHRTDSFVAIGLASQSATPASLCEQLGWASKHLVNIMCGSGLAIDDSISEDEITLKLGKDFGTSEASFDWSERARLGVSICQKLPRARRENPLKRLWPWGKNKASFGAFIPSDATDLSLYEVSAEFFRRLSKSDITIALTSSTGNPAIGTFLFHMQPRQTASAIFLDIAKIGKRDAPIWLDRSG